MDFQNILCRSYCDEHMEYTPWIILPVVLGMLCTMLMYNENQYDMLKQLWIVPVNKMAYFFSKFAVVLVYSICFMLVTATASILTGVLSGYIPFDSESVLYLLWKCMEISLLTAFAVLPVLAVAAAQKGYILPVCLTLIYTFLGFILLMVNRKVNAQKFETAFYAKPDLRNVRPPEEPAKSEPATLDLESLVEQLQKSPELASALAALIAAQAPAK